MKTLFILSFSFISLVVSAQVYTNNIFDNKVKSIQILQEGNVVGTPVLTLLGGKSLQISFDYLDGQTIDFRYEVYHCDSHWKKTDLVVSEYVDRLGEHYFDNINNSVNTKIQYIHYNTSFPHENLSFKLSGNYILQVYNEETETLAFQLRFMVVEQLIEVNATVKQATNVAIMDTHHELDLNLNLHGFKVSNPYEEIYTLYQQNGRWDNAIRGLKPSFVSMESITYDYEKENVFEAGSEFNQFDCKNLSVIHPEVSDIFFDNTKWNVVMKKDEMRAYLPYSDEGDLNGGFSPAFADRPDDVNTDADYVNVKFELDYSGYEYTDSTNVYVCGGFNHWLLQDENQMEYNAETRSFTTNILLKQGFYDYIYARTDLNKPQLQTKDFNGSYHQTKNDYEVFIYFKDIKTGYDRIIGYQLIKN